MELQSLFITMSRIFTGFAFERYQKLINHFVEDRDKELVAQAVRKCQRELKSTELVEDRNKTKHRMILDLILSLEQMPKVSEEAIQDEKKKRKLNRYRRKLEKVICRLKEIEEGDVDLDNEDSAFVKIDDLRERVSRYDKNIKSLEESLGSTERSIDVNNGFFLNGPNVQ
ncbi:hypothetical protein ACOME3_006949 [Neoechinorhynchus agilis]